MKTGITIFLILLKIPCLSQDDRAFDPSANINLLSRLDSIKSSHKGKVKIIRQNRVAKNEESFELTNYLKGEYNHPQLINFCKEIYQVLISLKKMNYKIDKIFVKGFTDGTHNYGIAYSSPIPPECVPLYDKENKFYDVELAILRACYFKKNLIEFLQDNGYPVYFECNRSFYDAPDGVDLGGAHRKIEVQISYSKK